MTDKRLLLALLPIAMLSACNEGPADDGRAATGEVLEGTVSDAMLPTDRVQSEPPLEDPEAFAEAQEKAAEGAGETATAAPAAEATEGEAAEAETPDPEPTPEADD